METILIKEGLLINEGQEQVVDILIKKERIDKIAAQIDVRADHEVDASGKWIIPGIIDDQVHFREPGLTHKATIATESRAGLAGGVTSFMEMPNTKPPALTQALLEDKYDIARQTAFANYSFFMGASNDNYDEVVQTDPKRVCGIKIFMGSSTGNMLVDDEVVLEKIFANAPMIIATHCEDESTIKQNLKEAEKKYGNDIPFSEHPIIRNAHGCYLSSSKAVELAKKTGARLHILHISSAMEPPLFDAGPIEGKQITAEVCVHHLHFTAEDYETLGSGIKCNPAIKFRSDRDALWQALAEDRFDIIATDHAPHTYQEKQGNYFSAPSGLPLVQHAIQMMLAFAGEGKISPVRIVEKMCHSPAKCFDVQDRGFVREGYWADLVLIDPEAKQTIDKKNILYKCGWSPLEGKTFTGLVEKTWLNGILAYDQGQFAGAGYGKRLVFNR